MDRRTQRALAVTFSILIVTATLTPASATLSPPNHSQTDSSLSDSLTNSLAEFDALPAIFGAGNGNGNGNG
ncbi:hypothetical protein, partial [Halorussus ruber]|uniref:hypothetical protein n=1 Tax=Halorussus ruber TaxID=1126238 RepID=UPI001B2FE911